MKFIDYNMGTRVPRGTSMGKYDSKEHIHAIYGVAFSKRGMGWWSDLFGVEDQKNSRCFSTGCGEFEGRVV